MSWDSNGKGWNKIRWERLFTTVGGDGQPQSYFRWFLLVLVGYFVAEYFWKKRKEAKKARSEIQARLKKLRKENPTPPQQLIDNIDKELKLVETIMDEGDIINTLNNIKTLVKTYRQKYDEWY
jgi:hypothetical protein